VCQTTGIPSQPTLFFLIPSGSVHTFQYSSANLLAEVQEVVAMEHSHQSIEDAALVWRIGVFDAHCHPTDIMASIKDVSVMKARALTIMASRSQDQDLVAQVASKYALTSKDMCDDASSCHIVPAFGWHPWFSYQLYDDRSDDTNTAPSPSEHYRSMLTPGPDAEFLDSLPPPRSLSDFLVQTEERLRQHPYALVGEVGLDRAFRLPIGGFISPPPNPSKGPDEDQSYTPGTREGRPLSPHRVSMDHQKIILKAQFELAGKLRRPVSIHSVQAHGVVFELLQQMWAGHEKPSKRQQKRRLSAAGAHAAEMDDDQVDLGTPTPLSYPPRICMHSYSGPLDPLRQFLHSSVPAEIYFSFSTLINFSDSSSAKAIEVIKAVPESRILIESDFHCAGQRMDDLLADIVQRVCDIKGWSQRKGAEQLRRNWERFVFGE
jgi:Tat protein secretion system quality control protein TatD with DNase activity